ncbi:hypothetical protein GC169_13435 [bacterium]|nr:hypothetical protein [bacterium]
MSDTTYPRADRAPLPDAAPIDAPAPESAARPESSRSESSRSETSRPRPPPSAPTETVDATQPRSLASKLFRIPVFGWVRLAFLSIAVGAVLRLAQVNPLAPDFSLPRALGSIGESIIDLGGWAILNGWAPLLTGALIVGPVWFLWRLISLPFRN